MGNVGQSLSAQPLLPIGDTSLGELLLRVSNAQTSKKIDEQTGLREFGWRTKMWKLGKSFLPTAELGFMTRLLSASERTNLAKILAETER